MARYFDGFVIPIPTRNLAAYRRMARKAGRIWRDHGALEFKECVGEDLNVKYGPGFRQGIKSQRGETVLFSFIGYKSRAHRDRVNARVMQDPRMNALGDVQAMPFDMNRMIYGGFKVIASA
jgi:uncharacterized protein YbaA (DUF1428 family)